MEGDKSSNLDRPLVCESLIGIYHATTTLFFIIGLKFSSWLFSLMIVLGPLWIDF